jgi:hypothetical protein
MIRSITVINHKDELLEMVLSSPEQSGFAVTDIDGLAPGKTNISITEFAGVRGGAFNSSRKETRNIVLSILFIGTDIEALRNKAYNFFLIGKKIRLIIKSDLKEVEIYGYVESNEANIFTKNAGTQVSLLCPDACFSSTSMNIQSFSGIVPLFQFPINLAVSTSVGKLENDSTMLIQYIGDVSTGIDIFMTIHEVIDVFEVVSVDKNTKISITPSKLPTGAFKVNDEVLISTIRGSKCAYLFRDGNIINIIGSIPITSDWFQLENGENTFTINIKSNNVLSLDHIELKMSYTPKYEGV